MEESKLTFLTAKKQMSDALRASKSFRMIRSYFTFSKYNERIKFLGYVSDKKAFEQFITKHVPPGTLIIRANYGYNFYFKKNSIRFSEVN